MGKSWPALLLILSACGLSSIQDPRATDEPPSDYFYTFQPLPSTYETSADPLADTRVELGRMLFFDPRLSASKTISCASCHDLERYGVDRKRVSIGHRGQTGTRNAPSVYNAAGYVAQFWDGRSPHVEDQARHPILNPVEMAAGSESEVVATLRAIPGYVTKFGQAFPRATPPITYDNMVTAIGAFERRLVTPGRFDAFLRGDKSALDPLEREGFKRFVEIGCAGCHNGPELGGHNYEKIGHLREWPKTNDLGRFEVTRRPEDRLRFRVPGLRNVAETQPYFHDGSISTLGEAVATMSEYQLSRRLTHEEQRAILAFLRALTGELPRPLIERPELPMTPAELEL